MKTREKILKLSTLFLLTFLLMNFSFKNENTKNNINLKSSKFYSSWTGIYVDRFGSTLKIIGPSSDGGIKFELLQTSQSCIGQIEGTAYLTSDNVANFQDEDKCHLNFTYNPGSIQISEYNCNDYRGSSCGTFDGFYKKKLKKKKRK